MRMQFTNNSYANSMAREVHSTQFTEIEMGIEMIETKAESLRQNKVDEKN